MGSLPVERLPSSGPCGARVVVLTTGWARTRIRKKRGISQRSSDGLVPLHHKIATQARSGEMKMERVASRLSNAVGFDQVVAISAICRHGKTTQRISICPLLQLRYWRMNAV